MKITLTLRHREVLRLLAEGDEIILNIEPQVVNELRHAGLITRTFAGGKFDYSVTEKGYKTLKA